MTLSGVKSLYLPGQKIDPAFFRKVLTFAVHEMPLPSPKVLFVHNILVFAEPSICQLGVLKKYISVDSKTIIFLGNFFFPELPLKKRNETPNKIRCKKGRDKRHGIDFIS